jgi:hypothetical protein
VGTLKELKVFDLFGAEVAAEFGPRLNVRRPEENAQGKLMGPHCFDADATVYLTLGANVTIAFFDAAVDHDFEAPPVSIFRGPCWGYQGTLSSEYKGDSDGYVLCPSYCTRNHVNETATITMDSGQPARYNIHGHNAGYTVSQPHSWTASNGTFVTHHEMPDGKQICGGYGSEGTGSGSRPAEDSEFLLFDGAGYFAFSDFSPGQSPLPGRRWNDVCEDELVWTDGWHNRVILGYVGARIENGGLPPSQVPLLSGSITEVDDWGVPRTTTYNLKRVEVPRPRLTPPAAAARR